MKSANSFRSATCSANSGSTGRPSLATCRHSAASSASRTLPRDRWYTAPRLSTARRTAARSRAGTVSTSPRQVSRSWSGAPGGASRTARDSTRRIRSDPLTAVSAGSSRRVAATPSTTSPIARRLALDSPSDGSTCSM